MTLPVVGVVSAGTADSGSSLRLQNVYLPITKAAPHFRFGWITIVQTLIFLALLQPSAHL
ncbi:hypothetical protein SLH49_18750 [Cognatiyoonia sp. IB215446]|uniref:hypothetical protein n=1 Tax=Cognatiyoonia sp. IB215446 TaxID=3097355 RepID=UPI002A0B0994|nr:hypothetical protein [Cognatiyoonia sp. IB215446]MDX8350034.1 hypothetical protein [Cognatiyoonia sp. IB215446]